MRRNNTLRSALMSGSGQARSRRRNRRNANVANVAKGQIDKTFDTQRLPSPLYPKTTDTRIKVTQTFLGSFDVAGQASGPSYRGFSIADLMGNVPGGLTYWAAARLDKVVVFLKPDSSSNRIEELQVTVPNFMGVSSASIAYNMPMTFRSDATDGNSLPTVAFRYGLSYRMKWSSVADAGNIFTVTLPSTAAEGESVLHRVVIQFTVELVSPQV